MQLIEKLSDDILNEIINLCYVEQTITNDDEIETQYSSIRPELRKFLIQLIED